MMEKSIKINIFQLGIIFTLFALFIIVGVNYIVSAQVNNAISQIQINDNVEQKFISNIEIISDSTHLIISLPINDLISEYTQDIYTDQNGLDWNKGTAFAVREDGWLITANHVLQDTNQGFLLEFDENNSEIRTPIVDIIFNSDWDFAIVKVDKNLSAVNLIIDETKIKPGMSVGFMGFPRN